MGKEDLIYKIFAAAHQESKRENHKKGKELIVAPRVILSEDSFAAITGGN